MHVVRYDDRGRSESIVESADQIRGYAHRYRVQAGKRLVNAGAKETVIRLNSRVDALRTSLPTAARLLDSALAEAK